MITSADNIHYSEQAVTKIYELTNGHPFFTQILCSLCFDYAAFRDEKLSEDNHSIGVEDVESLIPQLFSRGDNVFAWIWDGLPPAERIITSTLAQLLTDDKPSATQEEIEQLLLDKGIRIVTRLHRNFHFLV